MPAVYPLTSKLPAAAGEAVAIVRELAGAGHVAFLAGGCVRDLLLGQAPHDYDVATDAPPVRVRELFHATRLVGAQFGVVLVRRRRRWIEVATFRADGPYSDGRHPAEVRFTDAREDALRRDFTVNGMFLDPLENQVIDYVAGRADLEARLLRAIGQPAARFEEDHLRLLRAVRLAARLDFAIEPETFTAIRSHAAKLGLVAAERVREELEKTLQHPNRRRAFGLMRDVGLLAYLWAGAAWHDEQVAAADALLDRLPREVTFELAFAALVADRDVREVHEIARALAFSNEQRETTAWLVEHQADLDEPEALGLARLKRLMAGRAIGSLRQLAETRYAALPDGRQRASALAQRLAGIRPDAVQPPPLVTGDDLAARRVAPGPIYKELLDVLYTRQLEETLSSRADALAALDGLLRARGMVE